MKNSLLSKKNVLEYPIAFLIIFLITIIYLYPIFLGKVDNPVDIRNVQMYPWRHHFVDTKLKKITLWKNKPYFFKLSPPLRGKRKIAFNPSFDELTLIKLNSYIRKDLYPYLLLHYKPINYKQGEDVFQINFINKVTDKGDTLQIKAFSGFENDNKASESWFTVHIPLDELKSIKDISLYKIELIANNLSGNRFVSIYFKDLEIVCENYSKVPKIHNPYLSELIEWYTPAREYFSNCLKKGTLPFWSNFNLTGNEFLAEYRIGFFHPFYFLVYFFFDHFTAHLIVTFISFFLCGLGAFLLARYLGLNFLSSIFTSVVYMFHPFNVTHFSYEHVLMCSAILPFLLLSYEKNLKEVKLINKYLLVSVLLLSLLFLSGEFKTVIFPAIFFFVFISFRFFQSMLSYRKDFTKHLLGIVFVFFLSLMICQVILFPQFVLFQESFKVEHPEFLLRSTSLPIKTFATLIYPYYFGFPEQSYSPVSFDDSKSMSGFLRNYIYFGLLPFLFSLLSLRMFFKEKLILFFYSVILFSVIICTGSSFYYLFKYFFPGFKYLEHYQFIALYSFSVPFLSGIGFQIFSNFLKSLSKTTRSVICVTLIVISVIDLMFYSSYFLTWSERKAYKTLPKESSLTFLQDALKKSKEPFRVLPIASYVKGDKTIKKIDIAKPNTLFPFGIEELSGNSILIPKSLYYLLVYIHTKIPTAYYKDKHLDVFENCYIPYPIFHYEDKIVDLLNVKYFLVPKNLQISSKYIKKVYDGDSVIYENLNSLPRAFIVPDFIVANSIDQVIYLLEDKKFNPLSLAILDSVSKIPFLSIDYDRLPPLKYALEFVKYEHDQIKLKVKVNHPSFLILGNNLNENWKVKINGQPTEHFVANLVQRVVFLPEEGSYLVEFYYYPELFIKGFIVTSFALFLLFFIYIISKLAKRDINVSPELKLKINLKDLFVKTHESR